MSYLILCRDRVQGVALWWRSGRSGYTTNVNEAGRYSKDEADSIARLRSQDFPVPEEAIGTVLKPRTIVTTDDAGNGAALRDFAQNGTGRESP